MKNSVTPPTYTPTLYEQARAANLNPNILPNWNYNDNCYIPKRTMRATHEQAATEAQQIIDTIRAESGDYVWVIDVVGTVLTVDLRQRSRKYVADKLTIENEYM